VARIVFTDPAIEDLRRLGPSVAPRALKKILLLEKDAKAGRPLGGDLTGFRKLVAGNRHWRVVYRVDNANDIEICEIWAAGARSDGAIYKEATARLAQAANARPELVTLTRAVERLGRLAAGVEAADVEAEPVPDWLADSLTKVAGMPRPEVAALDASEAFRLWNDYITGPR
jgi:mRNA interferase RelE/StbE